MFQNTKIFLILFIISMFLGSNSHAQSTKLRDAFKNSKTSYQSGNLEKAILEIDSLEVESRGALDAWLQEAKAKKDASVAAENILAKTTAALKIKN